MDEQQIDNSAPKPAFARTLMIAGAAVVVAVVATTFVVKSDAGVPATTTTTSTIPPALQDMDDAVDKCNADAFYEDDQIVFSLDEYAGLVEYTTMDCIADELMSPATYAQWGSSTAMAGLQEVSENGLVFKFSYNGLSETAFLSVEIDDSRTSAGGTLN